MRPTLKPAPAKRAPAAAARPRQVLGTLAARAARTFKRADPVLEVVRRQRALTVFFVGTLIFARLLNVDLLSAAYFVTTTITTTGYGDITPKGGGVVAEVRRRSC